jgi:hypothetical protein
LPDLYGFPVLMRPANLLFKKTTLTVVVLLLIASPSVFSKSAGKKPFFDPPTLYEQLKLASIGLKESIFKKAVQGWTYLKSQTLLDKPHILSIADFSQSANSKRLYVIDMEKKVVLFHTYVSHGRNSGGEYARTFGNKPQSFKSSLGFYVTGATYKGSCGLSMRLKGLEKGINHNAEVRGIVLHGAHYANESFIKKNGRLGRSQGCPVVPEKFCKPIIDSIKEGSCLFIFYPDSNYFKRSVFCD